MAAHSQALSGLDARICFLKLSLRTQSHPIHAVMAATPARPGRTVASGAGIRRFSIGRNA